MRRSKFPRMNTGTSESMEENRSDPAEETSEEVAETAEEAVEETVEPEAPVAPVTKPVPPVKVKVRYVGGQGIELAYPLSNGLRSFIAGQVYELSNYGDFCRLTEASPHFVEVKD